MHATSAARSGAVVAAAGTAVTETVYRQQLKPVMEEGATAMDRIFPSSGAGS
jgi:hypothetical protein